MNIFFDLDIYFRIHHCKEKGVNIFLGGLKAESLLMLLYPLNLKLGFFLALYNSGGGDKVVCRRLCLYFGW